MGIYELLKNTQAIPPLSPMTKPSGISTKQ